MLSSYSTVADTPEIQRIKTTQQNISAVSSHYFFSVATLKLCFVRRAFFPHCLIFGCIARIFCQMYIFPSLK